MGFDIDGESADIIVSIALFLFRRFFKIDLLFSGLCREQHFGSDDCQEVGHEVRHQRRRHRVEGGPDHHGQAGGRTQAQGHKRGHGPGR